MSSDRDLALSMSFWRERIVVCAQGSATSSGRRPGGQAQRVLFCVSSCVCLRIDNPTFFGASHSPLSLTHLITRAHENLPQALFLPRRKHQYTRQIVVVPAHLFFAEEAHHLVLNDRRVAIELCVRYARRWVVRDKKVVKEGRNIVEDGFRVKEEFGEKAQILRVELVLLAVNLVKGVPVRRIDVGTRRFCAAQWTSSLCWWLVMRVTLQTLNVQDV